MPEVQLHASKTNSWFARREVCCVRPQLESTEVIMAINLTVDCTNCGWTANGSTDDNGPKNFDEILRRAQRHANREDHTITTSLARRTNR